MLRTLANQNNEYYEKIFWPINIYIYIYIKFKHSIYYYYASIELHQQSCYHLLSIIFLKYMYVNINVCNNALCLYS